MTLHDFGSVLGHALDTSFGLSQFHGHGSWLVCEVALRASLDYGEEVHNKFHPRQGYLRQQWVW